MLEPMHLSRTARGRIFVLMVGWGGIVIVIGMDDGWIEGFVIYWVVCWLIIGFDLMI